MKMPVADRKFFIRKHNSESEARDSRSKGNDNSATYSAPDALNEFAMTQTQYEKNKRGGN